MFRESERLPGMVRRLAWFIASVLVYSTSQAGGGGGKAIGPRVDEAYPALQKLYIDLHEHPELAFQEKRTASVLASGLEALGFEVTTGVGGTGVVGILQNRAGPVVMLRTEMDALPLEEKTGLPYASTVASTAHACGHDLHMAAWLGSARLMAASRASWHGTLMMVGQPAEETGAGAKAMLDDGLFSRFSRPAFAISMHDDPTLPSGVIGYHAGFFRASADALEVTIFGRGGHGARPQLTVDPILIAARAIVGLQTLVSRENDPMDPAVVTVGAIQAGTVANIIADQATLRISVRAFSPQARQRLLAGIERQVKAEAQAASAPSPPAFKVLAAIDAVWNDLALTQRMVETLKRRMGAAKVVEMAPQMTSEDFSRVGLAGVPAILFHIGAVDASTLQAAAAKGTVLPGLHTPQWAPDLEPTLKALVTAETLMLLELLRGH